MIFPLLIWTRSVNADEMIGRDRITYGKFWQIIYQDQILYKSEKWNKSSFWVTMNSINYLKTQTTVSTFSDLSHAN